MRVQIYVIKMKTKRLTELIENGSQGRQMVAKWRGVMRIRKRKEGRAYGSCDKPKGERLVKGGGDCGDKSKMVGGARAPNGQRGDDSQMDQGRAQGASEVG